MKFDTPFVTTFFEGAENIRVPHLLRITREDPHDFIVYDYLTEETYPIDRGELEYDQDDIWYLTEDQLWRITALLGEAKADLEAAVSDLTEMNDELRQERDALRIVKQAVERGSSSDDLC